MFGGLEVKGETSKDGKDEKPATAASSGFSFMATAPAPAPEAPAASGFSFMGNGAPAAAPEPAKAPEQSSGFSFMGGAAATPAPAPPPAAQPESSASSGFNFLQTPVPPAPAAPQPELTAPSSSFSFMSSAAAAPPEPEKSATGLGPTPDSSAPSLVSSSSSSVPVGSGITFGGASAATKKPIKKRSRANKVGAARAAELPAPTMTAPRTSYSPEAAPPRPTSYGPPSVTSSPPRPPNYSNLSPKPTESEKVENTKEAAQEAVQRAEEFLAQKMNQQDTGAYVEDYGPSTPAAPKRSSSTTVWAQSPEDDDDYAAAKAAAEEARAQLASGRPNQQQDGLMGRLFSRKTPWGGSGNASVNSSSQHSLPTVSANETPAERMQREQDEIKRAVAERQLAMNVQEPSSPVSTTEDDGPLTVEIDKPVVPEPKPVSSPSWGGGGGTSIPRTSSWTRPIVAASPPSPPPKTPSEKLNDILNQFEDNVKKAMNRVAEMRDHHKGLLDERLLALAKERLATQSMAAAEAQQMQAAEAEDYDLADRLGAVIDGHAREKSELTTILDNIGRALAELDSQKTKVVGEVARCFERVKEELKAFEEDQKSNDKKDDTEAMAKFATVAKQLSSEQNRLSSDEKHLLRDEKTVEEERNDLEMSISEQTAGLEKQRDSARANLLTIEEEIEVLRRQLEAKEATASGLRAEVDGHESEINRIRETFARQLGRVERKEASVKENRYEWEKEKIAHDTAKLTHEKEVEAHHAALVEHDALMEKLRKEIALSDAFQLIVAAEVVFEKSADQDLESDGDFAQLQADVVKSEAAVSEGKQILKAAEAALNELKEERDSLIKQIPMLEKTKTEAAASREFKKAGRASKQIKDAAARLSECKEELSGEAQERKDAALEDLVALEKELQEKQAVLNEQEKEAGQHAMEKVADKIRRLVETKNSVCGEAEDAAGIQAVGAFVLNGQVEALMREGSACGEKYGGWEAIAAELVVAGVLDSAGAPKSSAERASASGVSPGGRPADEVDPEVIAKFRAATRRLQEVEEAINAAVADDDFEAADKLNEELEEIKVEWEAIDLTAAEIKIFEGDDEEEAGEKVTAAEEGPSADGGDEAEEASVSSHESETQEASSGESGYSSEEGTELMDGSENGSVASGDNEENGESTTSLVDDSPIEPSEECESTETDHGPAGSVQKAEADSSEIPEDQVNDAAPPEGVEKTVISSSKAPEEKLAEETSENGASTAVDVDKDASAGQDEAKTPATAENGH